MGQYFSSDEDYSQAQDAVGSILYDAMFEAGAVPDLGVVHPLLLANQDGGSDSQARLQEQLKQMQRDLGNRAPSYIKDLIGRLTTFSDEPRLAGLVGLMVTLVLDMAYTSSRPSTGAKGKVTASSSSQQSVEELQEVMEEYLKRCRINLSQRGRLMEDSVRLEGMISLILTQLKACMLRGDCDSRSLRHWASGAVFHTQMLVHLATLEDLDEPLVAREALQQYKEDLTEIIAAYRRFKSSTVQVMKCRSGFAASHDSYGEIPEDGTMTGLTVTDSETGKSVTLSLSTLETETGKRRTVPGTGDTSASPSINLDLITSDHYAQAYLDYFFSDKGPVAELQKYFDENENIDLQKFISPAVRTEERRGTNALGINVQELREEQEQRGATGRGGETAGIMVRDESLKLSITETQPQERSRSERGGWGGKQ